MRSAQFCRWLCSHFQLGKSGGWRVLHFKFGTRYLFLGLRIGNCRVTQAKNDKIYWEVAYISMKLFWDIIFSVVSQAYVSGAHEVYVIVGNSALVKCEIPSFVSDFVSVVSWVDNEGNEFFPSKNGIFINKRFKIFWWWDTHEFFKLFFYFFYIT